MNYVIYREDESDRKGTFEIYYHALTSPHQVFVETTTRSEYAMHFPSARAAYDYAGKCHLDAWKVGAR